MGVSQRVTEIRIEMSNLEKQIRSAQAEIAIHEKTDRWPEAKERSAKRQLKELIDKNEKLADELEREGRKGSNVSKGY